MFWSVASVVVVASMGGTDLSELELRAWKKVQPSIVMLMSGREVRGSAALISGQGYFLTHATALSGNETKGRTSTGKLIDLSRIATDETTQFVLLRAEDWSEDAVPLQIADSSPSRSILVITPSGPTRGDIKDPIYGIMGTTRRMVAMNEIRLENNMPSLAGSLLINLDGRLVGALNATLGLSAEQEAQKLRSGAQRVGTSDLARGGGGFPNQGVPLIFGPGIQTAAFTVGPKVMRRVFEGFLSKNHEVKHPAIGVFCRDALPKGATIVQITADSMAEKAGLRVGDIIFSISGRAVRNQIDFAQVMADQEVGETLTIWIQRNGLRQQFKVEVGSQP